MNGTIFLGTLFVNCLRWATASSLQFHSFLSKQARIHSVPMPSVHFIYTTGCNQYQLIHSIVLDHTWRATGNEGQLTRIVAGCQSTEERDLMSKSPLRDDSSFRAFFAQGDLEVIPATGERYPARSRPHALEQWMQAHFPKEDVVAILDPDMAFLKPLSQHPSLRQVARGKMVSADGWESYGDGTNTDITPDYATGPVWFINPVDLQTLIPEWKTMTDTWPKAKSGGLMREQFSFQKSAMMHKVPATFVDDLATEMLAPDDDAYVLHYFRSYGYGSWAFHKALASSGWYADHFSNSVPSPVECGAPLLQQPPPPPDNGVAVTLSVLLKVMNSAFRAQREAYCPDDAAAFKRDGPKAFGLMRLMQPRGCPERHGELTRYRVDSNADSKWDESQALGGSTCSAEALMLQK
jgi:hypothetical protein